MITQNNIKNARRYCREDYTKIRGFDEAVNSTDKYDIHHLNELTFTRDELIKMNMYYHRPASEIVWLSHSDHRKWHDRWNGNPMYGRIHSEEARKKMKESSPHLSGENSPNYGRPISDHAKMLMSIKGKMRTGEKNGMYGKKHTDESRKKMSDNSWMRGRTGDKNPSWKGDEAGIQAKYNRAKKLYKSGQLTKEEFELFRKANCEEQRKRHRERRKKK